MVHKNPNDGTNQLGWSRSGQPAQGTTEMKAVFSMDIKGTTSINSSDAISSSSGGVTDTRRDGGRAMRDAIRVLYLRK